MGAFIIMLRIILAVLTVIHVATGERGKIARAIDWLKEKHKKGIGVKFEESEKIKDITP